jgi:exocyst complex component 4
VRYLKNALGEAKGGLLTTKPELKGLATSSQAFDDSLQLFTQIESIQAVPEKLEGHITEKRFLTAVDGCKKRFGSPENPNLMTLEP